MRLKNFVPVRSVFRAAVNKVSPILVVVDLSYDLFSAVAQQVSLIHELLRLHARFTLGEICPDQFRI
jgi:hypothetical protein